MQESKRRGRLFVALSAILALVVAGLLYQQQSTLERTIGDLDRVVIASKAIPARTSITADMLTTIEIPHSIVHNSYVLNATDALDFVAITDIEEGQIIQRNMLDQNYGLQPGYRAVSIATDRVGSIGGNVRPLNRVDIIVSYIDDNDVNRTSLFLEDVLVIGVNSLLQDSNLPAGLNGNRFLPDGRMIRDAIVTLSLPPDDAAKLVYMDNFGSDIRLVARRLDEPESPPVDTITLDIFNQ